MVQAECMLATSPAPVQDRHRTEPRLEPFVAGLLLQETVVSIRNALHAALTTRYFDIGMLAVLYR